MTDPIRNIADLEDAFFGGGQDEKYDALRAFERAGVGADDLLEVVPAVVAIATLLSVLEVVSPEDAANMIGRLPQELIDEAEAWAYYGLTPWDPGDEPENLSQLQDGEDEEVGRIRDFFRRIFSTGPYSGGTPGKSVLSGVGAPDGGVGVNGDFYIDTATWEIYGPKALNTWPSAVSLVGPQGATGPQGPQGATGPTGATGATGPGVAIGGTTGQVLVKNSGSDYDTAWSDTAAIARIATGTTVVLAADTLTGSGALGTDLTGKTWTETGSFTRSAQSSFPATDVSDFAAAIVDVGEPGGIVACSARKGSSAGGRTVGVIVAWVDSSNHIRVVWDRQSGGAHLSIQQVLAGVTTTLAAGTATAPWSLAARQTQSWVRIVAGVMTDGTNRFITANALDRNPIATVATSFDSTFDTATKVGIVYLGDVASTDRYRDFLVTRGLEP